MLDQVLIFLLCLEALLIAVGLCKRVNMWPFIVMYWVTLTVKNAIAFFMTL